MNMSPIQTADADFDTEAKEASQESAKVKANHSAASYDTTKKSKKASGAFRTISEVADLLDVQQHVLRFWETKFTQVRPMKRGGGRRYYRPEDVSLLQRIHHLLYTEGYTIKGVQKLLKGQGKAQIIAEAKSANDKSSSVRATKVVTPTQDQNISAEKKLSDTERSALEVMLEELKAMRAMIKVD